MIYTAYLDESDTHGDTPNIIMAGILGFDHQWARFNRSLRSIRKKHNFDILHATELKRKKGEFRGWSTEQCMNLVTDITAACERFLSTGCVVNIPYSLYITEY